MSEKDTTTAVAPRFYTLQELADLGVGSESTLRKAIKEGRLSFHHFDISRQEVFRWCMRYNTRRRHSWCNFLAPNDFEALTSATLTQAA